MLVRSLAEDWLATTDCEKCEGEFRCLQVSLRMPAAGACQAGPSRNPANVVWTFFQVCPNSSSSTFPKCIPVQGLEHVLRALRRTKQIQHDGKYIRVPKLRNRNPKYLPKWLHAIALIPMLEPAKVVIRSFVERAQTAWSEPVWSKYFENTFLHHDKARWWYGLAVEKMRATARLNNRRKPPTGN